MIALPCRYKKRAEPFEPAFSPQPAQPCKRLYASTTLSEKQRRTPQYDRRRPATKSASATCYSPDWIRSISLQACAQIKLNTLELLRSGLAGIRHASGCCNGIRLRSACGSCDLIAQVDGSLSRPARKISSWTASPTGSAVAPPTPPMILQPAPHKLVASPRSCSRRRPPQFFAAIQNVSTRCGGAPRSARPLALRVATDGSETVNSNLPLTASDTGSRSGRSRQQYDLGSGLRQ